VLVVAPMPGPGAVSSVAVIFSVSARVGVVTVAGVMTVAAVVPLVAAVVIVTAVHARGHLFGVRIVFVLFHGLGSGG